MTDVVPDLTGEFAPGVAEKLAYYVYLLIDPRPGRGIFYVGKGCGPRCFAHEAEVLTSSASLDKAKRLLIQEILGSGHRVRVEILRHGLDEAQAFLVESAAIDLLGEQLTNEVAGHHSHELGRSSLGEINARFGARPLVPNTNDRLLLIRLNVLPEDPTELYERTRKWWRISSRWTDLSSVYAPTHAVAVFRGVARTVFEIERWVRATEADCRDEPARKGRFAFDGRVDAELSARYRLTDVSERLPDSAQNPLYFLNCGPRLV